MYFELFKLRNWRKRSAEVRRHNCAVLPKFYPAPGMGALPLVSKGSLWVYFAR